MLQVIKHLLLQSKCGGGCVTTTVSSGSSAAPLGNGAVSEFFGDSNISSGSWDATGRRHMGLLCLLSSTHLASCWARLSLNLP